MSIQVTIEQKLENEFATDYLKVENESHMHAVAKGSELHFKVTIVSDQFRDQTLIKRHRMVNKTLQQELQRIHALALHTLSPEEWRARGGVVADSPNCHGGGKNQ